MRIERKEKVDLSISIGEARLRYDAVRKVIRVGGTMRFLSVVDYSPVMKFFTNVSKEISSKDALDIDFRDLQYLNSPGIATISLFAIHSKRRGYPKMRMLFSKKHAWQERTAGSFKRLWDEIEVNI